MTRLVNAVLMLDAMALFCCWRSANVDDASPLAEYANVAWMGDVPCLRHYYYYSCAWWA
jgi:hypothetical protein